MRKAHRGPNYLEIDEVRLIERRIVTEESGQYKNRFLELVFEAKTSGAENDQVESLEVTSAQANLDYDLNPSEFFIHARPKPHEGVRAAVLVATARATRFKFHIYLDQRK